MFISNFKVLSIPFVTKSPPPGKKASRNIMGLKDTRTNRYNGFLRVQLSNWYGTENKTRIEGIKTYDIGNFCKT
jgi:hypothetical protein